MNHSAKKIIRQYAQLVLGFSIIALGVSFSIRGELGTSPISSVPYVLSLILPISVGTGTIILHVALVLLQIIILRKDFKPIQLLQIVIGASFGYITDFWLWVNRNTTYSSYFGQWVLCLLGIVLIAIGVYIEVDAKAIPLAAEGLAAAIVQKKPTIKFGDVKIRIDVTLVATATILSLVFLHKLKGVREGTFAAAILVGLIVKRIAAFVEKRRAKQSSA